MACRSAAGVSLVLVAVVRTVLERPLVLLDVTAVERVVDKVEPRDREEEEMRVHRVVVRNAELRLGHGRVAVQRLAVLDARRHLVVVSLVLAVLRGDERAPSAHGANAHFRDCR